MFSFTYMMAIVTTAFDKPPEHNIMHPNNTNAMRSHDAHTPIHTLHGALIHQCTILVPTKTLPPHV